MLDFDGVDQDARNNNGLPNIDVAVLTYAGLFTTNGRSGTDNLWNTATAISGAQVAALQVASGTNFKFRFQYTWSTTIGDWRYDTGLSFGTRHHFMVVYNRGATTNDPAFYLDGVSVAAFEAATPVGTVQTGADSIIFGASKSPGAYADCEIAEYAIWSGDKSALAPSLSDGYSPLFFPEDQLHYWDMIEDGRDQGPDESDLTLTNSPAVIDHPGIMYPESPQVGIAAAAAAGRIMSSLAGAGGLAGPGGIAGPGGGLAG